MATDNIERLHYYQRQYLGMMDFEDEQAYLRDMRRRLNLAHHTWGIVSGLELKEIPKDGSTGSNAVDIYITPGMAIDGYGREIVILQPTPLDAALFQTFRRGTRFQAVYLEYSEALSGRPQSGYQQCDVASQYGRIQETFRVSIDRPFRDSLIVASKAVLPQVPVPDHVQPEDVPILPLPPLPPQDAANDLVIPFDESVPYQEFPIDDPTIPSISRWFILLGTVKWDGDHQQFIPYDSPDLPATTGRHYIGTVASRIYAPAKQLVVRDRSLPTALPFKTSIDLKNEKAKAGANKPPADQPPEPTGVMMIIEGALEVDRTLQVDGVLTAKDDIQLHGGRLDFRAVDGSSDGAGGMDPLLTISRRGPNTDGVIDLLLQIGKDHGGKNRLVVGAANDLFTITDDGKAQFTGLLDVQQNLTIEGILEFGNIPRQMITFWSSVDNKQQNGIGTVMSGVLATTYFRSSSEYLWYKGGAFTPGQSDPGSGAQVQLKLDTDGSLHFDKDLDATTRWRQMLNLSSTYYGIGVQQSSLYFRSDSDFYWYKGGSHTVGNVSTTGTVLMKLSANGSIVNGSIDVNGSLNVNGPLVVNGPSIAFLSTTNPGFSVKLGQPGTGVYGHGSDSIYGSPNLWLDAVGAVIAKQGFRISPRNGAAFFTTGTPAPQPGDVVVLDKNANDGSVIPSTAPNDPFVVGVAMAPTDPGFILAKQPLQQNGTLVALMGIVPCHVDNTGGITAIDINVGDLLTTSSTKGYAQLATSSIPTGAVLGKAMDVVPANQQKTIDVLIMPG